MKNRIKEIRKNNKLTQVEFGEKIGVKGNTITNYENGLRTPSDAVIFSICREFGINEEWLRTGTGDMLQPIQDRFSFYLGQIKAGDDDFIKDLIETYMELDQISKDALRIVAYGMAEKFKKKGEQK